MRWLLWSAVLTSLLVMAAALLVGQLSLGAAVISFATMIAMALLSQFHRRSFDAPLVALLAALNIAAYNPIKGALNTIPFSYDRIFADIDWFLGLGQQPHVYLREWLDFPGAETFYGASWFVIVSATLIACASRDRMDLVFLYFVSWSIFGPFIHIIFPAAGPIYYERLGLGDRYADLPSFDYADTLWSYYQAGNNGLFAGISAMPSLHILLATWVVVAWWNTILRWPAIGFALLMFAMSISTGWHYAIDGIASAAVMWGASRLVIRLNQTRETESRQTSAIAPANK